MKYLIVSLEFANFTDTYIYVYIVHLYINRSSKEDDKEIARNPSRANLAPHASSQRRGMHLQKVREK